VNAGQLAALIAAGFFAVLACVAMVVLLRFGRLVSAVTRMVTGYRDRADLLIEQAQAAVDRTNAQLARTDAITESMDQVTANMAELSGHVSALAGLARNISSAASAPVTGVSAVVFGLRRAMLVRRSLQVAAVAEPVVGTTVDVAPTTAAEAARERQAITAARRPARAVSRR
jgi:methyl-accepting chemotaxis protein